MAHAIPDQILDFDKASRADVIFNALSVNQTSTNGVFYEKEIDFVVYHREKGILCIEAKNGADISYYGGEWRYSGGRPMSHRGPFKQVQLERITVCARQGAVALRHCEEEKRPRRASGNLPSAPPPVRNDDILRCHYGLNERNEDYE